VGTHNDASLSLQVIQKHFKLNSGICSTPSVPGSPQSMFAHCHNLPRLTTILRSAVTTVIMASQYEELKRTWTVRVVIRRRHIVALFLYIYFRTYGSSVYTCVSFPFGVQRVHACSQQTIIITGLHRQRSKEDWVAHKLALKKPYGCLIKPLRPQRQSRFIHRFRQEIGTSERQPYALPKCCVLLKQT